LMVMPPNTRAGFAILGAIALLFALHRFTGPHEIRKPIWNPAEDVPFDPNRTEKRE